MRIQCKGCGKEYKVNEKKISPEGLRVKCRSCGAILVIRLREKTGAPLEKEEAAHAPAGEMERDAGTPAAHSKEPLSDSVPEPSSEPAPLTASRESGYRFCMHCGLTLDRPIAVGELPVCGPCMPMVSAGTETRGVPGSSRHKTLLFVIILLVLIFAAFMGYRIALGNSPLYTAIMSSLQNAHSMLSEVWSLAASGDIRR